MAKEKLLLHLCCAPCGTHPLRQLKEEYDLTLYYYNPNIHPREEYHLRYMEVEELARLEKLPLVTAEYAPEKWLGMVEGLENEPERGKRCEACIGDRMEATARKAEEMGIPNIGAVMSVSPHKDAAMINRLGDGAGKRHNAVWYEADWKKKEGFKISARLSRAMGLRRQNYCGCAFSIRNPEQRAEALREIIG